MPESTRPRVLQIALQFVSSTAIALLIAWLGLRRFAWAYAIYLLILAIAVIAWGIWAGLRVGRRSPARGARPN
jgi:hypothetical protein